MKKLQVEIQQDTIEKLSKSKPIQAVSKMIWNALDADAKDVRVTTQYNGLGGLETITIADNGTGFSPQDAEIYFVKLGDSWKKLASKTKIDGRYLHGKEGQGRFKALSLGRVVNWKVRYKNGKKTKLFSVEIIKDNIKEISLSDISDSPAKPGVTVEIREPYKNFTSLETTNAVNELTEIFALYLRSYNSVKIDYDGIRIDPSSAIETNKTIPLSSISDGIKTFPVEVEIIEWKTFQTRSLYLCSATGFPYTISDRRPQVPGRFQFTAYLKSSYLEKVHNESTLGLVEMSPILQRTFNEAQKAIREYFIGRAAEEAQNVVTIWKNEKVYPYETDPTTKVEEVERKVFDIVAVNVNDNLPDFSEASAKQKRLNLRLLRQSIERNPDDLQHILDEVFNLSPEKRKELSNLLQNTTLTAIINASKLIADRLRFLVGLEAIVFDLDLKRHLRERSQLHLMLKDHTWIFGEEFNLSLSDQSLTEVLKKHKQTLGEEILIDEPVLRDDGTRGIVDLMFSRLIKTNRDSELEHLVVELKAPKVSLKTNEASQIQSYAFAVADDERFKNVNTRWNFWILSNDMDGSVAKLSAQSQRAKGILYQSERGQFPDITVWVKTWAQVIQENKSRLKFVQEKLEYQADKGDALQALQDTYADLWKDTKAGEALSKKLKTA